VKDGYSPQEFYIEGSQQGPSSDLYALGATFYHVLTGAPPPNSHARLAAVAANDADPYIRSPGVRIFSRRSSFRPSTARSASSRRTGPNPPSSGFTRSTPRPAARPRRSKPATTGTWKPPSPSWSRRRTAPFSKRAGSRKNARGRRRWHRCRRRSERKPYFSWQIEDGFFTEEDARESELRRRAAELETVPDDPVEDGEAEPHDSAEEEPDRPDTEGHELGQTGEPVARKKSLLSLRPSSVWRFLGVKRDRQDHLGKAEL
jgi:hypothetical protein